MGRPIPYRIETPRLVLRCWDPLDAPKLKEAVDASLEHLTPWMPWATHEPQTIDEKIELLRLFRGEYDLNRNRVLAIFDSTEQMVLGGTGMHPRHGPDETEIGYWVRSDRLREGIASEAASAIVRVAFEYEEFRRIEIRCDPRNVASHGVPVRLGFDHEATLRERIATSGDSFADCDVFSLFRSDYDPDRFKQVEIVVYDAMGRRITPNSE